MLSNREKLLIFEKYSLSVKRWTIPAFCPICQTCPSRNLMLRKERSALAFPAGDSLPSSSWFALNSSHLTISLSQNYSWAPWSGYKQRRPSLPFFFQDASQVDLLQPSPCPITLFLSPVPTSTYLRSCQSCKQSTWETSSTHEEFKEATPRRCRSLRQWTWGTLQTRKMFLKTRIWLLLPNMNPETHQKPQNSPTTTGQVTDHGSKWPQFRTVIFSGATISERQATPLRPQGCFLNRLG